MDQHLDDDQTTQLSGLLEILYVHPDPEVVILWTKAVARARHTQAPIDHSPQYEEGDNDGSGLPEMTPSSEEPRSEDRSKVKSSAALQSSPPTSDASTSQWCIEGMEEIYREGMQPKESGKLVYSIYHKP